MTLFQTAPQTTSLKARPFLRFGAMAAGALSVMLAGLAPPTWSQVGDNRKAQLQQECTKRKAQLGLAGNLSTQAERDKARMFDVQCAFIVIRLDSGVAPCATTPTLEYCRSSKIKEDLDRSFNQAIADIRSLVP